MNQKKLIYLENFRIVLQSKIFIAGKQLAQLYKKFIKTV